MSELVFASGGAGIPAVSWLIGTHVADTQLHEALTSCFAQTYTDFECVVVVNGAEAEAVADSVRRWFGADARLFVFTTSVRHLTFSLALGMHLVRAPLVARIDGDDIALPDRLARQVEFMNTNPAVSVLGSDFERIDANGRVIDIVTTPRHDAAIRKALFYGNPLCHPSVMFRREPILAIGGYLGGIYAQDYDLWVRLAANPETKFANLQHACIRYRMVGVGTARNAGWSYASMAAVQYRNFVSGAGLRWAFAALITTAKAIFRSLTVG